MNFKPLLLALLCMGVASLDLACRPRDPGNCDVGIAFADEAWQDVCRALDDSVLGNATVLIGNFEGRALTWSRGDSTEDTPYRIASASKWLAAATMMRLVQRNAFALDDEVSRYLSWWTDDASDRRSRVKVQQLLSFTSGFKTKPLATGCFQDADTDLESCARELYDEEHVYEPGTVFIYGPAHLQVAGALAEATGGDRFSRLFRDEVADVVGMSEATQFVHPSADNPRVAGGAESTAADYELFLESLFSGRLLQDETVSRMHQDWTPVDEVTILYSPLDATDYRWHYGLGSWRECEDDRFTEDCQNARLVSSPGLYGFHPWIDFDGRTYGIIAREDPLWFKPSIESVDVAYAIRPLIDDAFAF